jgi:mRNA-degrading endonuclease toxin of MazEF toxin-antitoxin module
MKKMARFAAGDLIVFPMPLSDGSGTKRRPSLVLKELPYFGGMDYLVCYITSRNVGDAFAIELLPTDLVNGVLTLKSYLRPLYLFAPAEYTIARKIGTLTPAKLKQVREVIASAVNP